MLPNRVPDVSRWVPVGPGKVLAGPEWCPVGPSGGFGVQGSGFGVQPRGEQVGHLTRIATE
jgi:hypothetical protein